MSMGRTLHDGGSKRAWLPLTLVTAGIVLLSGCIFVPIPERTIYGINVAARIGSPDSAKPIRLRRTTRDEVLATLGQPALASPDGRELTYTWGVQTGVWVWPFCGHPAGAGRVLTLKFDDAGVLRDTEVPKEYRGPYQRHDKVRDQIRWGGW